MHEGRDPNERTAQTTSLLRTSALIGGACAFLLPGMPVARAACTVAVTGAVSCTGTTATTRTTNTNGDPAGASARTQVFDNGASINGTIAKGAVVRQSGLRLTQASPAPGSVTLSNDGNVTNYKSGQTLRLDGNGGMLTYSGDGRVTNTSGKGTALSLDNVGGGGVSVTTGNRFVGGGRGILATTAAGAVTIATGSGLVAGTAGRGLDVTTGSGAISVTAGKGGVSSTGRQAISTATVDGDTTIDVNGTVRNGGRRLTKTAPSAVLATSTGAANLTVGGAGTVISNIGRGIWAQQEAGGTGGILITGTGATQGLGALCPGGHPAFARKSGTTGCSGLRGVIKNTADASDIVIDRSGNVTATSAAINGFTFGNGNIRISPGTNSRIKGFEFGVETMSSGTGSISVATTGSKGTVTTSGTGILAQNAATAISQAAGSRIDVSNEGTITTAGSPFIAKNKRSFNHTDAAITAGYLGGDAATPNGKVYGTVSVTNAGTLRAAAGDGIQAFNLGNGKLAITNSGTITAPTGIALFGGAGVQGTITNTGDIRGRTAIDLTHATASTLDQQAGTIRGDILLSGTGDTLNVTGGAIDGRIVGNSAANGANAGTVNFAADSFRTGGTVDAANINIDKGTLILANRVTVAGAVTNNATLQVGGLRSQTIDGSYVQTGGATLAVALGPGGSGRLDVTKTADLSGTLDVLVRGGYSTTRRYTILTADGGVSGQFTSIVPMGRSTFQTPTLTYTATSVVLTFPQTRAFASVATTSNQAAAANALQGAVAAPLARAVLAQDLAGARQALAGLSGDIHGSAVTAGFEDSRLVREAILNRLQEIDASAPTAGRAGFWGRGFGDFGRNAGNGATLDRSTGGFVIGGDAPLSGGLSAWRLGFAGAYMEDAFKSTSGNASGSLSSGQGAVYAGARYGAWDLRLAAAAGGSSTVTNRSVAFPGFADADHASYGGLLAEGFGEVGYRYGVGRGVLEPLLTGAAIHIHETGFSEQGGMAALTGAARGYDLGTTTLGLRGETPILVGLPLVAHAFVGWRHAYGDVDPRALLAFSTGSPTFAAAGVPIDRDALSAQAGLDWRATSALTLGLAYSGQIGARAQDEAVRGKLEYAF